MSMTIKTFYSPFLICKPIQWTFHFKRFLVSFLNLKVSQLMVYLKLLSKLNLLQKMLENTLKV